MTEKKIYPREILLKKIAVKTGFTLVSTNKFYNALQISINEMMDDTMKQCIKDDTPGRVLVVSIKGIADIFVRNRPAYTFYNARFKREYRVAGKHMFYVTQASSARNKANRILRNMKMIDDEEDLL